jgi:hypothetical protein
MGVDDDALMINGARAAGRWESLDRQNADQQSAMVDVHRVSLFPSSGHQTSSLRQAGLLTCRGLPFGRKGRKLMERRWMCRITGASGRMGRRQCPLPQAPPI